MIYVTGRFGYVGSNLIPFLESKGHDVIGIGRYDPTPKFRPDDCVVNCACAGWRPWEEPDVPAMEDSNACFPIYLAASLNGANMIHLGASVETQRRVMPYSRTKALASKYLKQIGTAHICNIFTIFGGKNVNTHRFMDSFIKAVKTGAPYELTEPYGTRDWMHVKRICEGIESLLYDRNHKEWEFGSGVTRKFIDVYDMAQAITGKELDNIKVNETHAGTEWRGANPPFFPDYFPEDFKGELLG